MTLKDGDSIDFLGAVPKTWNDPALVIKLERRVSFTSGSVLAASIDVERLTASGRKGKPEHLLTLVANDGDSPADLLRQVAQMFSIGTVTIGESYPAEEAS